jgi:hypothetical protein
MVSPFRFPTTIFHAFLLSSMRAACPAYRILLDLITLVTLGDTLGEDNEPERSLVRNQQLIQRVQTNVKLKVLTFWGTPPMKEAGIWHFFLGFHFNFPSTSHAGDQRGTADGSRYMFLFLNCYLRWLPLCKTNSGSQGMQEDLKGAQPGRCIHPLSVLNCTTTTTTTTINRNRGWLPVASSQCSYVP